MANVPLQALIIIVFAAAFAVAGILTSRKVLHGKVREGHNDVLVPIFLTAGTIYAVLIGFMVVAQWETFDNVSNNSSDEAANLVPLYRLTNGMQPEHGAKLRVMIREYAEAVIKDEWKLQLEGKQSSPARKAIGDMLRTFATLDPKTKQLDTDIDASFLQTVSLIVQERNKRGVQAQESLSPLMWIGAIIGGIFIVGMTFLLYMERGAPHVMMSSLMAMLIAILLIMILVLSRPFVGPLALTPEPFEHSLQVFDDVDKGN